ncbi:unnamed protein product, partial [Didymodactylos carnosus]
MTRIPSEVELEISKFCNNIRQHTYVRSVDIALATVLILKKLIGESTWTDSGELIQLIRSQANRLNEGQSIDSITFNIIRRILKLIREESSRILHGRHEGDMPLTLQGFSETVSRTEEKENDQTLNQKSADVTEMDVENVAVQKPALTSDNVPMINLKPELMFSLNEYNFEIGESGKMISRESIQHIHANELILTLGHSHTVEEFFKYAASKKRKFQVFVMEQAPYFSGHIMAKNLADLNINVT